MPSLRPVLVSIDDPFLRRVAMAELASWHALVTSGNPADASAIVADGRSVELLRTARRARPDIARVMLAPPMFAAGAKHADLADVVVMVPWEGGELREAVTAALRRAGHREGETIVVR